MALNEELQIFYHIDILQYIVFGDYRRFGITFCNSFDTVDLDTNYYFLGLYNGQIWTQDGGVDKFITMNPVIDISSGHLNPALFKISLNNDSFLQS